MTPITRHSNSDVASVCSSTFALFCTFECPAQYLITQYLIYKFLLCTHFPPTQIYFTQKCPLDLPALMFKNFTSRVTKKKKSQFLNSHVYRFMTIQQWDTTSQKYIKCQKDILRHIVHYVPGPFSFLGSFFSP